MRVKMEQGWFVGTRDFLLARKTCDLQGANYRTLYVLSEERVPCRATVGRLVRSLPGMDVCQKRKRDRANRGEEGSSPVLPKRPTQLPGAHTAPEEEPG